MAVGLPDSSVDRVFDFIDDIWDAILVLVLALLEVVWDLLVIIFIDLSVAIGFSLVLCIWLYMFYVKFVEPTR